VNSIAAFNHWRVEAERTNARLLYMSRADLTQRDAQEAGTEHFPDQWPIGGNLLPLEYKFEPAEPADGVCEAAGRVVFDGLAEAAADPVGRGAACVGAGTAGSGSPSSPPPGSGSGGGTPP